MKNWILAALTAGALISTSGLALADSRDKGRDKDRGGDRGSERGGRGNGGDRGNGGGRPGQVAAPEIDGASGALAIALAGGGLALLQRSRRRRA